MNIPFQRKFDKYAGYFLVGLLILPTRLLGVLLRRNHKQNQGPDNLLFIKILGLGSLVQAAEGIQIIRERYPKCNLILITNRNIADGISPFQLFDEIWDVRTQKLSLTLFDTLRYLLKSFGLRKMWIADLEVYSKLTTVYSLLTMAVNRFGFILSPVFFRKYLNTHNVIFDREAFIGDNYIDIAKSICFLEETNITYRAPRDNTQARPYIALNNTCSDLAEVRKLPESTFAEIGNWVMDHTGYKIALLGAPGDKKVLDEFIHKYFLVDKHERIFNASEISDFGTYYRFLTNECAFVISIDSAPLHIAKRLGIPTVSIWGPTNPRNHLKVHPEENNMHQVCYNQVVCSPCVHRYEVIPCGGDNFCIKNIHAEEIIEKIRVQLNQHAQPQ